MKNKKVRQGVFETNSSSTHSICIAKTAELNIPKELHFTFGEFGWENGTLQSVEEKASYLYTGLISNEREEDFNKIVETLTRNGVDVTNETKEDNGESYWSTGYVDHSDELGPFLDAVCNDEYKLMKYLFSDLSFVRTGNDNDDTDVSISVSYPYDSYYKGN